MLDLLTSLLCSASALQLAMPKKQTSKKDNIETRDGEDFWPMKDREQLFEEGASLMV